MYHQPDLTCLCLTYGRFTKLRDCLACFLAQDIEPGRIQLLIYNFAQEPIVASLPQVGHAPYVKIINEPTRGVYAINFARAVSLIDTEWMRPLSDDDWFLPHACRQGLDNIGWHPAFKEKTFWFQRPGHTPERRESVAEGSLTIRTEVLHRVMLDPDEGIRIPSTRILDLEPSWVFFWYGGVDNYEDIPHHLSPIERSLQWQRANNDHPQGRVLTPSNVPQEKFHVYRSLS